MTSITALLLQAAVSLLLFVQANPHLDASLREQAITIANQAIKVATEQVGERPTSPSITILSPTGAEMFVAGQAAIVRWSSNGFPSDMPYYFVINLERKLPTDTQYWHVAELASNLPVSGTYIWAIDSELGKDPAGTRYKLVIGEPGEKGTERLAKSNSL